MIRYFILLAAIIILSQGCGEKELDAIDEKETSVSIEKVSSISTFPGKNRVKVIWKVADNPAIKKCRVYWDDDQKWIEVPITPGNVNLEAVIPDLEEKNHTFSVYAYDDKGNASPKVITNGRAYGNEYQNTLTNRPLKKAVFREQTPEAYIEWDNAAAGTLGLQVKYLSSEANEQSLYIPYSALNTSLANFTPGESFSYRTLYVPTVSSIDTFYTAYESIKVDPLPVDNLSNYSTLVTLNASGAGNVYEQFKTAWGSNAEETPDCRHPQFGQHISEEHNSELNKYVFSFYAHVTPDDDRCSATDRQRTEVKTHSPSRSTVKAFLNDEMVFRWKFKLAAGFQPSSGFTHIHQIKAGDGTNDGSPLITITPRYGNPNKLEIIHTGNTSGTTQGKVRIVNLAPFEGEWIEATEKMKFSSNGTYELVLKRVSDGEVLLTYNSSNMDFWRTAATFIRPKWGIYRSLSNQERLRDEKVLFADFEIGKK
ncbi:DUF4998 domain-containing protein [Botryobacter ruber]|uniref:DUF4998 domain-containing protein n=1 Tax=Botryobacter ruber TaxID=2171629 RepID=UPI0013E34B74|nr:DUF4998 domain-containing protein [Botryobacter ruber]